MDLANLIRDLKSPTPVRVSALGQAINDFFNCPLPVDIRLSWPGRSWGKGLEMKNSFGVPRAGLLVDRLRDDPMEWKRWGGILNQAFQPRSCGTIGA